jgi:hypothetical protein
MRKGFIADEETSKSIRFFICFFVCNSVDFSTNLCPKWKVLAKIKTWVPVVTDE